MHQKSARGEVNQSVRGQDWSIRSGFVCHDWVDRDPADFHTRTVYAKKCPLVYTPEQEVVLSLFAGVYEYTQGTQTITTSSCTARMWPRFQTLNCVQILWDLQAILRNFQRA